MSFYSISTALDNYFATFVPSGVSVAWEGVPFQPTDGQPYYSPRVMGFNSDAAGFGANSLKNQVGTYQVSVYRPVSEGKGRAIALADKVAAFFPRGHFLTTTDGLTVVIENATPVQPVYSGTWIMIPVIVRWICSST